MKTAEPTVDGLSSAHVLCLSETERLVPYRAVTFDAEASLLEAVVAFALSQGASFGAVAKRAGAAAETLLQSRGRVPALQLMALLDTTRVEHPGLAVSIKVAELISDSLGGGLVRTGQFAPDVRTALELFGRFGSLFVERLRVGLEEGPLGAELCVSHPCDELDHGGLSEVIAAFLWKFIRTHARVADTPLGATLHAGRRKLRDRYQRFFLSPLSFSERAYGTRLLLPRALLDAPLRFACPAFFDLACKRPGAP